MTEIRALSSQDILSEPLYNVRDSNTVAQKIVCSGIQVSVQSRVILVKFSWFSSITVQFSVGILKQHNVFLLSDHSQSCFHSTLYNLCS